MKFDMNDLIKVSNMISTHGRITSMEYEVSMTNSMIIRVCDDNNIYEISISMYPDFYHVSIKQAYGSILKEKNIDDLQELSEMLYYCMVYDEADDTDEADEAYERHFNSFYNVFGNRDEDFK